MVKNNPVSADRLVGLVETTDFLAHVIQRAAFTSKYPSQVDESDLEAMRSTLLQVTSLEQTFLGVHAQLAAKESRARSAASLERWGALHDQCDRLLSTAQAASAALAHAIHTCARHQGNPPC